MKAMRNEPFGRRGRANHIKVGAEGIGFNLYVRGVGLFFCVRDHRAADIHIPRDVCEEVKKLKEKASQANEMVDVMEEIVNMCLENDDI